MILSIKQLLKRPVGARPAWRVAPASRIVGAVLCAWTFAAIPAHAQDPGPSDDSSANAANLFGSSLPEENKDLPDVQLSSQIVFQVLAAEIALQRNEPAPAYQTYLALARDTHDPRMAQRAAEIALAAQSPSDALAAAQLWHEYAPDSERAAQLDASLLVLSGKPDDAKPLLARELAKVPAENRGNALLALQTLLSRGPNRVGGLQVLQDLLKDDMGRPEAQLAVGRQQLLADDRPGARASFERALKLKPDFLPAALSLGQMGPEERKEGIASFESYVKQNPKARDARLALAQLYLSSDRLDDAKKQFESLRSMDAHDPMPLLALGLIKVQQKQYDAAQKYLTQYADLTEKTPGADPGQAYLYLAQLALEQKHEQDAAKWLDRVQPSSQQYITARVTRAQLLAKSGKPDDARRILSELQPSDPREQALVARTDAAILFDAKRYQDAESRLHEANEAFPGDPEIQYDYAMAAEKNGHYDLMESVLRKVMQEQPDNPQAYNALGYSLADRNLRLDEADKLIEKASSLAPNDAFIMDSLGWVKYRKGNTVDAAKLLKRAYEIQPNAEIGAHLGEVLWKSGDQKQALDAWRSARKLEPDNDTLVKTLERFQVNADNL
ncbi:tetratricopeptide repeat protein [Trinickia sp. Y13]|uniref:tetratricopeptide repeat protein n=1 Tax=Trinickia sp. Y13 TaxID=2917807 RepID=UPI002406E361|nr:tetratricopeptide repeat protein [Trinickia sp. Y13]MDG0023494.1 tetratricopeptide repeat protein [Trinickia sp. Y13]